MIWWKKKQTKLKVSGVSFFIWKIRVIVLVVVRVLESKDLYYQKRNNWTDTLKTGEHSASFIFANGRCLYTCNEKLFSPFLSLSIWLIFHSKRIRSSQHCGTTLSPKQKTESRSVITVREAFSLLTYPQER